MLWLFLLLVDKGQRFQIVIEDPPFVRQLQECVVQMIRCCNRSPGSPSLPSGVSPPRGRSGKSGSVALVQADRFRGHDLVVFAVLQHAVLVNAGGVGEGAGADDGLIRRDRHIADLADGLAGAPDFMMINVGVHVHDVFAHFDRHDHFFQRAVAGAFADTVHRTFYGAHRRGPRRGRYRQRCPDHHGCGRK